MCMSWVSGLRCLVSLCLLSIPVAAATVTFSTPENATTSGGPVNATASFNFIDPINRLEIILRNNQANPASPAQLLSGIRFELSGSANPLFSSAFGIDFPTFLGINPGGSTSFYGSSISWGFGADDDGFVLCTICPAGVTAGASPAQMIIGPAGPGGLYTNAGSSITDNPGQEPYINQSAQFNFGGVASTATVSNVSFLFGSPFGANVVSLDGQPGPGPDPGSAVPEPGSIVMAVIGLFSVPLLRRANRLNRRNP